MENDKPDLLRHNLEKISWLSFKNLNKYFCQPEMEIENQVAISAQKFADDLDSVIQYSKFKSHIPIGKPRIIMESITPDCNKSIVRPHQGKFKLRSTLFKTLKNSLNGMSTKNQSEGITKKVAITSWNYDNFRAADGFKIGELYTIKPVSLMYNFSTQDYMYEKQITASFYIETVNGDSKKMVITDTIKNGKVKREKWIDGDIIKGQNYHFEIRSHRLNRGLMKAFLFKQIKNMINTKCVIPKSYPARVIPTPSDTGEVSKNNRKKIYRLPNDRKFGFHGVADDYGLQYHLNKRKIII